MKYTSNQKVCDVTALLKAELSVHSAISEAIRRRSGACVE
jgi:hypothetical protein